jgi:hypothetical protein
MKKTFKQTVKSLDKITDINYGGCGLAALALFDAAKREGKKVKIVYCYTGWDANELHKNNQFKEGKRKKATSCHHVVIKLGKRYWDSTGTLSKKEIKNFYTVDEEITRKHLIASINNKGAWNDVFKRKKWMPEIKKLIKKNTAVKV